MLASYLGVGWCREEKCVSLLPRCGWVCGFLPRRNVLASYLGVGVVSGQERNVLASYLGVGGCREEKCVSLLARCGWV